MKLNEVLKTPRPHDDDYYKEVMTICVNSLRLNADDVMVMDDGTVSVGTDVVVNDFSLVDGHFPFQFAHIEGSLTCRTPELKSMEGAPTMVWGHLRLERSSITSFEHFPKEIGTSGIGGGLVLYETKITDLRGIQDHIESINGFIYLDTMKIQRGGIGLLLIKDLKGVKSDGIVTRPFQIIDGFLRQDRPEDHLFDCQAELIDQGFEEYAEL